ncbi:MAG: cytochrome c biogenesis protein CcdA [Pseudomonadota bacterium]
MRPPRACHAKFTALLLTALALLLALPLSGPGPAAASDPAGQPDAPARLLLVPLIDGYPAGSTLPLMMLLVLPPGQALAPAAPGQPALTVGLRSDSGLTLSDLQASPARPGEDGSLHILLRGRLEIDTGLEPGPRMVKGAMELPLSDGRRHMEFVLPLNILAVDQRPQVVSPEMAARLGVASDGAVAAPTPGRPPMGASPAAGAPAPAAAAADAPDQNLAQALGGIFSGEAEAEHFARLPLWAVLALSLLAGLVLNLTPCVYPMIPLTVSFFGGRTRSGGGALMGALAYWLGMALTYSGLGALAALSGQALGAWLGNPIVVLCLVAVFLLLATSMFGLWEIRLPAALTRIGAVNRGGVFGALLMGLTVGILAAPCIGPVVLALMTHVAGVGRVGYGLLVFFCLSLGLGAPLAMLAFFSGSLTRLPGAGEWMLWVRKLFGVVLVLMAVYTAQSLLGPAAYRWLMALAGAAGGLYLAFWEKSGKGGFIVIKRLIGLALVVAAGLFWWYTAPPDQTPGGGGHLTWTPFSNQVLAEAAGEGRPVVLDFMAAWCAPCKQMDAETFSDPRVHKALAPFQSVRVDVTSDPGPEAKALMRQWRVRGVPTIAFLDKKGQIIPELTVVGFMGPEEFITRIKMVMARVEPAK